MQLPTKYSRALLRALHSKAALSALKRHFYGASYMAPAKINVNAVNGRMRRRVAVMAWYCVMARVDSKHQAASSPRSVKSLARETLLRTSTIVSS